MVEIEVIARKILFFMFILKPLHISRQRIIRKKTVQSLLLLQ